MSVLTQEAIAALAELIAEIDFAGAQLCHVEMGELGDGSWRPFAIVTTIEAVGLEQTYRVCGPAAAGAPVWAASYSSVEVRVGERWRTIPFADPQTDSRLLDRIGSYVRLPAAAA